MRHSPFSFFYFFFFCLLAMAFSLQADAKITIPTVLVDDPNNPADIVINPQTSLFVHYPYGCVKSPFHLATYDTTASQYVAFLNAVAKDDPNHLYDDRMTSDANVASIVRKGTPGTYNYTLKYDNWETGQLPIVYVSWFSAARFCNWLHNGQLSGKQDSTTTEKGAYDLTTPVVLKHPQHYCDFLNAVAKSDPHGLYESTLASLITRQGEAGNYVYALAEPEKQKEVTLSLSWASAARFANWKKNKIPNANLSSSPDDLTEKGLYVISEGIRDLVGDSDIQPTDYCKIAENAQFFLPTEDQYYKAAFYKRNHDANNQLTNEYWIYSTQSDTVPGNNRHAFNAANYYIASNQDFSKTGWFDKSDYRFGNLGRTPFLTPVGAYSQSPSPYGAFDLGGNVSQWLNGLSGIASATRPIRGGGWGNKGQWPPGPEQLSKDTGTASIDATAKRDYIGFRVATP